MKYINVLFTKPFLINALLGFILILAMLFGLNNYLDVYTQHDKQIEVPDISKMKLFDALVALDNAGLKYEVDSFRYNEKYPSYSIFEIYPNVGSRVKEGRRIFLRANPKTWPPVTIPNLKDQYKNSAFRNLEKVGLLVGDTIFEPNKYKGVVLRMMYKNRVIEAGEEVPRFSKIDLVIGAPLLKDVIMDNLIGLSLNDAKRILKQKFFEISRIDSSGVTDRANARVFYQFPLPGDIYDQGESVMLWLSDKTPEELDLKITELNNIYNKTIKQDSTGNANYNLNQNIGNVSEDVRRQVNANVNEVREKKKAETPKTTKPKVPNNNGEGITVD